MRTAPGKLPPTPLENCANLGHRSGGQRTSGLPAKADMLHRIFLVRRHLFSAARADGSR